MTEVLIALLAFAIAIHWKATMSALSDLQASSAVLSAKVDEAVSGIAGLKAQLAAIVPSDDPALVALTAALDAMSAKLAAA